MKELTEQGMTPIIFLLIILLVGVLIGVGIYFLSSGSALPLKTTETIKPTAPASQISPTSTPSIPVSPTLASSKQTEASSITVNFSHTGSVFAQDDGWTFLWDEPGRLALNVKLKFIDQSVCYFGGEKKDCGSINMRPESYDHVALEGKRNGDEVTVIRLEELKLPQ